MLSHGNWLAMEQKDIEELHLSLMFPMRKVQIKINTFKKLIVEPMKNVIADDISCVSNIFENKNKNLFFTSSLNFE